MKLINNISIILLLSILFSSCNKDEEIKIVNREINIKENSKDYQKYLSERAISYVKLYRFEKAVELLNKIEDKEIIAEVKASILKYKKVAIKEAYYFVNKNNDTLYYRVVNTSDVPTNKLKQIHLDFTENKAHIINSEGQFYGFKNYALLEDVSMFCCLATKLPDLHRLNNLKTFSWLMLKEYYDMVLHTKFTPSALEIDFNKMVKLEDIKIQNADFKNIKFPIRKIAKVQVDGKYNVISSEDVKKINTSYLVFGNGEMAETSILEFIKADSLKFDKFEITGGLLKYTGKDIRKLIYKPFYPKKEIKELDVSKSKLEALSFLGNKSLKNVKLNNQLKWLNINNDNSVYGAPRVPISGLKENKNILNLAINLRAYDINIADLPKQLNYLKINYSYESMGSNLDFTNFVDLKDLEFSATIKGELKLPKRLEKLKASLYQDSKIIDLDLSEFTNLIDINLVFAQALNIFKTPLSLKKLEVMNSSNMTEIDLSKSTNLSNLELYSSDKLVKLIFPANLKESQFNQNPIVSGIPKNCIVVNKPNWLNISYN